MPLQPHALHLLPKVFLLSSYPLRFKIRAGVLLPPLSGCQFISKLMLTQLLYGRCKGRTGITELSLLDLMLLLYRRLEMPPGQYTSITKHAPFNGIFVAETDPSRFLDLLERRRTTILILPPLLARSIVSLWLLSAHALHRFLGNVLRVPPMVDSSSRSRKLRT